MALCADSVCVSLAVVLTVATLLSFSQCSPIGHDSKCERIRLTHRVHSSHQHSRGVIKGICPTSASSSCCAGLELAIESKTRSDFSQKLSKHLKSFRLSFEQRDSRIRSQLSSIFNETIKRVNEKYSSRIALANQELVRWVTRNAFRASQVGSVEVHADNLLQAIVISEYESHSPAISTDYINCLSSVNFVDFFGGIRRKLTNSIQNVIETSRLILQSFLLASKLMERSEAVRLEEKCVRQLAGSLHCGSCLLSEQSSSREPQLCGSTCRDIVGDCINTSELSAISKSWKELAVTLKKLVDSMVDQYNPETIFATYPSLLSEALELARSKNEISKKARVSCGPLERSHHGGKENSSPFSSEQQYPTKYAESLFVSIESMAHSWNSQKDIFDQLKQSFCANTTETGCPKIHPSASAIPIAQPLVNKSHISDEFFESLRQYHTAVNIIHLNRLNPKLNSTLYTWNDESHSDDTLLADGSGSGDTEPEDDEESSGDAPIPNEPPSTSSTSTTTDGINFPDPFSTPKPNADRGQDGTGSAGSLIAPHLLILVAVMLQCLRHHC